MKVNPDLALFISTAGKLTHAELDLYMKTFAKKQTNFLIFRESWWSMPISTLFFQSWTPEKTTKNVSPVSGPVADFQHNYFHFLDTHGYDVIMAEFNPVQNSRFSNEIYILAVRKALAVSAAKALNSRQSLTV